MRVVAATLGMVSMLVLGGCSTESENAKLEPVVGPSVYQRYQPPQPANPTDYSGAGSAVCTDAMKALLAQDFAGANRPEMMALGDSLNNGVQSLRINWWLSEWSAPTLIALRLGLVDEWRGDRQGGRRFFGPQYPGYGANPEQTAKHDFGFNLETLPSGGVLNAVLQLKLLMDDQKAGLAALGTTHRPPNGRPFVDNISFSGANSVDISGWTAREFRKAGQGARDRINGFDLDALGDAFTFTNAAFVLSPMHNPCVEDMTPLQQVLFRKPKRLFVNMGANNGIFRAAFSGTSVDTPSCDRGDREPHNAAGRVRCFPGHTIAEALTIQLVDDVKAMGAALIADPGVEHVYINGIVQPSRPANVVITRGADGQADYATDLFIPTAIAREAMDRADLTARDTNAALSAAVDDLNAASVVKGRGPVFTFIDVDKALDHYDYKRCLVTGTADACRGKRLFIDHRRFNLPEGTSQYLDNRPMRAAGDDGLTYGAAFNPKVTEGGLFSFDNMHLSSIGYEVMVEAVRNGIDKADPGMTRPKCADGRDPRFKTLKIGDCRLNMVVPGASYVDATRRSYIFQRTVGDGAMHNQQTLKNLAELAKAF
ncbi:hypothetical protein BH09PSE2_BH09PSE2_17560 [soil metagenome]